MMMRRWGVLGTAVCLLVMIGVAQAQTPVQIGLNNVAQLSPRAILYGSGLIEVQWSPGGQRLLVSGQGGASLYETGDLAAIPLSVGFSAGESRPPEVWDAAFGPDGRTAVFAVSDGMLSYFVVQEAGLSPRMMQSVRAFDLAYSPDGSLVAYLDLTSNAVVLWDVLQDRLLPLSGAQGPFTGVAFSPAGDVVYAAAIQGFVQRWDVRTLTRLDDLPRRGEFASGGGGSLPQDGMAVSLDGRWAAAVGSGDPFRIRVWNVAINPAGSLPLELTQAEPTLTGKWISALAFSPDSRLLAAAAGDGEAGGVWVWDVFTGTQVVFLPHSGVRSVAFSPDGTQMASAGDGNVRLWGLPDSPLTEQGSAPQTIVAYCDQIDDGAGLVMGTDTPVSAVWSWYAAAREQVLAHIDSVRYSVRLNERPLTDGWLFLSDIVPDAANDNDPTVYYFAPAGRLAAAAYTLTYEVTWERPIFDGYEDFGPETANPTATGTCTFSVR